ncbi:MAG: LacI family DNA-binding transcriptional regulator [Anaerolineaceae bacterium]|nr:LacI family DNA-binding transcriptional regulator [Anaerolineaceae bacterium]
MTKRSHSITIRDVARKAGVSVATVSRYINQNAPVSEKLSARIEEVMDQLDYVPHETARHLALRTKNAVGLLLINMHNPFFGPLLAGVESVVRENNYNLLVASYHSSLRAESNLPFGLHNTDGIIAFADSLSDEEIVSLYERNFPIVLIHKTPANSLAIPFTTIENKAATRKLINHLIKVHNRRRIILMRGSEHQEDAHWREEGFRAALDEHDIPFDESMVLNGSFEHAIAYHSLKKFLADPDHPEFDAVFAGDDDAAIGVYNALSEAGYKIPDDISVVGFDDSLMAPFMSPPLTTVRAPTEMVGQSAARQLFCLLEKKEPELVTLLPTEMILRQSCGCKDSQL